MKTASVITDATGTITEDEDYYPWGGELQFVNSDSNYYKFIGKERDAETGLDCFGARYYGNWTGRFLTPDWSQKPENVRYADLHDPQSLNLYSYVRNIPISKADDDGHDPDPQQGGAYCPSFHDKLRDLDATQPAPKANIPPPPPVTCLSCVQQQNNGSDGPGNTGRSNTNSQSGSSVNIASSPRPGEPAAGRQRAKGRSKNRTRSRTSRSSTRRGCPSRRGRRK
ncbi:MAG TPA: RHS repeat-associated core domain-containing protein [Candidatus Angelobacter sp.]|nr:RHS repeat-associated core domain-containing protein [Candidatus Angelobacter sp.]